MFMFYLLICYFLCFSQNNILSEVVEIEVEMQESDEDEEWWSKYGHEVTKIVDKVSAWKWSHYNLSSWLTNFYFDVSI
jgi:hypothetical protein